MAKVKRPSSGALETGIKEVGNAVTNYSNNKTTRYVSDNETGLGHHELDNDTIGLLVDGIIKGTGCLLKAIDSGLKAREETQKYEMESAKHHEEQETKRLEIKKELEIAKMNFEKSASNNSYNLEIYRNECVRIDKIWHEMLNYFMANPDDPDRSEFLKQMGDVQKDAAQLSRAMITGESKK